jgi:hypothetical protein
MYVPPEILVLLFLISFLIYTMPMLLVKFSKTTKGKFLLLMLTIVITLYNKTGGLLMAMLIIFLDEFNYEVNNGIFYEGFDSSMDTNKLDDNSANSNVYGKVKKLDQLTISEQLKSRPA